MLSGRGTVRALSLGIVKVTTEVTAGRTGQDCPTAGGRRPPSSYTAGSRRAETATSSGQRGS